MYKISAIKPLTKIILPLCYRHILKPEICCYSVFHQLAGDNLCAKNYVYQQNSSIQNSLTFKRMSMLGRIKDRMSSLGQKTRILRAGCLVYEKCADTVNYDEFFQFFNLPDTFHSWFLSIQLHVWMVIIVSVSEKNGREFRNSVVDSMWADVEIRLGHLAQMKSSTKKKYLAELVSQFHAALISYDEGVLSDDTVLAASAWRTLFSFKIVDPQILENTVLYIRKQLSHLDSLSTENIIFKGIVTFQPLNSIFSKIEEK